VRQVRPLLPGCGGLPGHRDQPLTGSSPLVATQGAHPLTVDLLSTDEAHDLLVRRLGAGRVAAEPDAVREIIDRCARLPLALPSSLPAPPRIPASRSPVWRPNFRDAGGGLDALHGGDAESDVRTVFAWSQQALSPAAAGLFRLLGLHPGPDFTAPAGAAPGRPGRRSGPAACWSS